MQAASVAVVDDEAHLREAVVEYLSSRGIRCFEASNALELKAIIDREPIDVVVLDINMPGESGLSIARSLRARGGRPGIIFATAAASSIDRVVGLELGADDYLAKPYELRELLARINSIMRRLPDESGAGPDAPAAPAPQRVPVGRFWFDLESRILADPAGAQVDLTAMEGDLLATLVTRPRRVLSRAQLLDLAHGGSGESERSIDIRVTRLRKKIGDGAGQPALIRTVRGEGYLFDPDGR